MKHVIGAPSAGILFAIGAVILCEEKFKYNKLVMLFY